MKWPDNKLIACHESMKYKQAHPYRLNQNGAYWYSFEIVNRIRPNVDTRRDWVTINVPGCCTDHAIVFIHNNKNPNLYSWLSKYDDLILVCGVPETCDKVAHLGKAIYLPLSIDVEYVEKFRTDVKTVERAYAGRPDKKRGTYFPPGTVYIEGKKRDVFLRELAKCRNVYAVGRCALEAKALGANILPYDPRFPDPSIWKVVDNLEAAKMLQKELDKIDKEKRK